MNLYKVTLEKIAFVRANNADEAKELALDDFCVASDERIISVSKSNKREVQKIMFGGVIQ